MLLIRHRLQRLMAYNLDIKKAYKKCNEQTDNCDKYSYVASFAKINMHFLRRDFVAAGDCVQDVQPFVYNLFRNFRFCLYGEAVKYISQKGRALFGCSFGILMRQIDPVYATYVRCIRHA